MDTQGRRHRAPARPRTRSALLVAVAVVAVAVTVGVWVSGAGPVPTAASSPPPAASAPTPAAPAAPASPSAPEPSPTPAASPSRARAAVDAADAAAGGRVGTDVGIAVVDLATGEAVSNDEGDTTFNAASLTKVLTVADVLEGRRTGRASVGAGDLTRIGAALGPSDDAAMNALWSRYGGAAGITRVIDRFALADTTAPDDPSQWGEMQTSARDMGQVFRGVVQDLPPADRDLVLAGLRAAPAQAADGFDQGFGLLEPGSRGSAAAKQGWLCCLSASIDLHSVGVLDDGGRYVLALLSNQPFGYDAARGVLDDAAQAARTAVAA